MSLGFRSEVIEDIPKLVTIRDKFKKLLYNLVMNWKTEAWLYSHVLNAGADTDFEALIYFKSKGESLVSSHELSKI